MSKMLKITLAILDWTFMPHGYDTWRFVYEGINKLFGGLDVPIKRGYILYKCKVCGNMYSASRRNKTCQNIGCFIKWRIR